MQLCSLIRELGRWGGLALGAGRRLRGGDGRRGWLLRRRRRPAGSRCSWPVSIENLLELFAIQTRRFGCRDPVLVGNVIGFRTLRDLLLIGRKLQVSKLFLQHHVTRSYRDQWLPVPQPVDFLGIDQQDNQRQMDDYGNPEGFPLARARQIILQLHQKSRNVVGLAISRFPTVRVIEFWRLRGG